MGFVKAIRVGDIRPGTAKTVTLENREYAVYNVDGDFYCTDNSCPHADGPLGEGDVEGDIVYCPWHYWGINIRSGEVTDVVGLCVKTFACKVEDEVVWVEI